MDQELSELRLSHYQIFQLKLHNLQWNTLYVRTNNRLLIVVLFKTTKCLDDAFIFIIGLGIGGYIFEFCWMAIFLADLLST